MLGCRSQSKGDQLSSMPGAQYALTMPRVTGEQSTTLPQSGLLTQISQVPSQIGSEQSSASPHLLHSSSRKSMHRRNFSDSVLLGQSSDGGLSSMPSNLCILQVGGLMLWQDKLLQLEWTATL